MFLKSVFQNKIFINILFFLAVFLSAFSFLFTFFLHNNDFLIPLFEKVNAPLKINVEFLNNEKGQNFHLFANGYEVFKNRIYKNNSYIFYQMEDDIKTVYFKTDDKTFKNLDNIAINLNNNFYYYSKKDIEKFTKTKTGQYILPFDIKYTKSSAFMNDKGLFHKLCIYFLSIFYNSNFYVFPLLMFFAAVLIYQNNKEKINLGFNLFKNNAILWVLIIGLLLRLQDNSIPFWGDELYSATYAGGVNSPFIKTFQDPGNPPLFFILAKIWQAVFGSSEPICRLLTTIFSVLSIYLIWFFVKNNFNKNAALLAAFIFSINIYSIHSAQEFRAYSLGIMLSLISAYFLFEIIKNKQNKNFVFYSITAILMANTHYFQILILFANFIFAMFKLENKFKLKFLYANLIAAISFLPYFLLTALNKGLLDSTFNDLPFYDLKMMGIMVNLIFSNKIIPILLTIIALLFLFKKFITEDEKLKNVYLYSFWIVFSIFLFSYLFSLMVRPIIRSYYFVFTIPFISILIALGFFVSFKNKILKWAVILILIYSGVFCFSGKGLYADKNDLLVIRAEEAYEYSFFDSNKYLNQNKKVALVMFDNINEYKEYYKKYYNEKIKLVKFRFAYDSNESFEQKLVNSGAEVFYSMVHLMRLGEFLEYFGKKFDISAIITDKNVVLIRMIKNK